MTKKNEVANPVRQSLKGKTEAERMMIGYKEGLKKLLPKAMPAETWLENAMLLCRDPKLRVCTPISLLGTIIGAAKLGLSLDPNMGHLAVVPFNEKAGKTAVLIPMYRGYIELARRGGVQRVNVNEVYDNDEINIDLGSGLPPTHRPWWDLGKDESGELRLAYCVAYMPDGSPLVTYMHRKEILKRRDVSKAYNYDKEGSIWVKWEPEQWMKTVIRKARKYWPQTPMLSLAGTMDDYADIGKDQAKLVNVEVVKEEEEPITVGTMDFFRRLLPFFALLH